ncbi:Radical SAM domain protein [uncultured Desulfobacterium sp.]|uniref:Radical SAM domain protein n=1 Tax=uncultured Desulfobacterium sp. TaxID=201089 RepID=A0A445N231_9BACT|nr:Radical SAM domain protein [uncultured Desulfobacterium sp.]
MKKQIRSIDATGLPFMLYADMKGRIYEHPYFRMAAMWGKEPTLLQDGDLIPLSEFAKLFYFPGCPAVGIDPETGQQKTVNEIDIDGVTTKCHAVAAFLEPGIVRTHLPAVDYRQKSYTLPMWAYTAVGFKNDGFVAAGFRIEDNPRWHPSNYDDRKLVRAIGRYKGKFNENRLVDHLVNCATVNHCFAAKNLFLKRWEAPMPVSRRCNASCLGCLSLQPKGSCEASHHRITFRPTIEELTEVGVSHLISSPQAIISFGQGCEGEPLTEYGLISGAISKIRARTKKGTINLNTNGSFPDRVQMIIESGLDSIRISLNSARPALYCAYYRPNKYDFEDVVESLTISRKMGVYTMINYLIFPGITDSDEEITAMIELIGKTGVNFLHLKNLCIDPQLYIEKMPAEKAKCVGIKKMIDILKGQFPDLELGYFNQPVRE